jgi:hypothetical protein
VEPLISFNITVSLQKHLELVSALQFEYKNTGNASSSPSLSQFQQNYPKTLALDISAEKSVHSTNSGYHASPAYTHHSHSNPGAAAPATTPTASTQNRTRAAARTVEPKKYPTPPEQRATYPHAETPAAQVRNRPLTVPPRACRSADPGAAAAAIRCASQIVRITQEPPP